MSRETDKSGGARERSGIFGIGVFWSGWREEKLPERYRDDPRGYDRAQLDLIQEAGGQAIPVNFGWSTVEEKRGVYDFSETDFQVEEALKRGFGMVAYIGHTPEWAKPPVPAGEEQLPGHRTPPDERFEKEFAAYCRAVAARYRGAVERYSFWNEPNGCSWINGGCSNSGGYPLYTRWLKVCYPALKAGDPDCLVSAGSLDYHSGVEEGWKYFQGIYDEGGRDFFDALDIHPYAPGGIHWRAIRDTRRVMVENGDAEKEMWISEYGWQDSWNPEAVRYLEEFLHEIRKDEYRFITHARYLVVSDLNEGIYGLSDIELEKRPVFDAFSKIDKTFIPAGSADPAFLGAYEGYAPGVVPEASGAAKTESDGASGKLLVEAGKRSLEYGEETTVIAAGGGEACGCDGEPAYRWFIDGHEVAGVTGRTLPFSAKPESRTVFTVACSCGAGEAAEESSTQLTVHPFVSNRFTVLIEPPDGAEDFRVKRGASIELRTRILNKSSHDLAFNWRLNGDPVSDAHDGSFVFTPRPEMAGSVTLAVECVNAGVLSGDAVEVHIIEE